MGEEGIADDVAGAPVAGASMNGRTTRPKWVPIAITAAVVAVALIAAVTFGASSEGNQDDVAKSDETTGESVSDATTGESVSDSTTGESVSDSTTDAPSSSIVQAPSSPGGRYDVVVTVGSFYNPIPSNRHPDAVTQTFLEFGGACDGVGPCSLLLNYDTQDYLLSLAVKDFVKTGEMMLTPLGDGSYSGTLVAPETVDCPLVVTSTFEVTLTPTSMTATFSNVPETREIFEFDGGQCWASTFDMAMTGTRPS